MRIQMKEVIWIYVNLFGWSEPLVHQNIFDRGPNPIYYHVVTHCACNILVYVYIACGKFRLIVDDVGCVFGSDSIILLYSF